MQGETERGLRRHQAANAQSLYDLRQMLPGAEQGKYVERFRQGTNLVLLQPDIAAVFPDEQAVNDALRLVIELTRIPSSPKKKPAKRR